MLSLVGLWVEESSFYLSTKTAVTLTAWPLPSHNNLSEMYHKMFSHHCYWLFENKMKMSARNRM